MMLDAKGKTRAEFSKEIMDVFETGIRGVFSSQKWVEWLSFCSSFHDYSAKNRFLIWLQNPEARQVASMKKWNELGRWVRKGEGARGLKIWAPAEFTRTVEQPKLTDGKPVYGDDGAAITEKVKVKEQGYVPVSVYDVSQTEGEPLPTLCTELQGTIENKELILNALTMVSGIPFEFENISSGAKGFFSQDIHTNEKRIVIQREMPDVQTIKTAIHETAHAMLHSKDQGEGWKKDPRKKEVEAESVAFIVSRNFGLDTGNYTFGYLAGWSADKSLPELKESLDIIIDTADKICGEMKLYVRGLNIDRCKHPEAVREYINQSPYLKSVPDEAFFDTYNEKLNTADRLASSGCFVEIYKSDSSLLPAGTLYGLDEIDRKFQAFDVATKNGYEKQGLEKAYDKVYFTVYYPTGEGASKYGSLTQQYRMGTEKAQSLSQHIMSFAANYERLKGIVKDNTVKRNVREKTHKR